ncbi:hypothetical protein B0H17DRAFT_712107 [Mycena rosella]|uniref:Uncharacterized protein n=1 Tax=Mycena rosella TaxID=1033263 RepID=A0AAD7GG48_MYCRO|nr:hypothetical protein B0H17DRAFT_712107 [Mycena rosella]
MPHLCLRLLTRMSPSRANIQGRPPVEPVNELTEAQIADLAPAESEAIQTLIQDMAIISAKNKAYLAQAATMREQTRAIAKETRTLTTAFKVEQFRRQRLENYLKHWRPIDPRWSYSAAWAGPITVAPVLVRYEGLKGYIVKEREMKRSVRAARY